MEWPLRFKLKLDNAAYCNFRGQSKRTTKAKETKIHKKKNTTKEAKLVCRWYWTPQIGRLRRCLLNSCSELFLLLDEMIRSRQLPWSFLEKRSGRDTRNLHLFYFPNNQSMYGQVLIAMMSLSSISDLAWITIISSVDLLKNRSNRCFCRKRG